MTCLPTIGNHSHPVNPGEGSSATAEPTFKLYESLLDELKYLVVRQLDLPTRYSLSWTCRNYRQLCHSDFDQLTFANKCAELGHTALLFYSVRNGAPFSRATSEIAAAHGHVDILEMHLQHRFRMTISQALMLETLPYMLVQWTKRAIMASNLRTLQWVRIEEWKDGLKLLEIAIHASHRGQVELALNTYRRAKRILVMRNGKFKYSGPLFSFGAVQRGYLEAALRFRACGPAEASCRDAKFTRYVFDSGIKLGYLPLISWSLEQDPALLTNEAIDWMIKKAASEGYMEILQFAEKRGGRIAITAFHPSSNFLMMFEVLPQWESLKFMHSRFNLSTCPFEEMSFPIPSWATREAMQWMKERGYRFEFDGVLQHHYVNVNRLDLDLIAWILEQGVRATHHDILKAARLCSVHLLDKLWPAKSKEVNPDGKTIAALISTIRDNCMKFDEQFRFTPLFRTLAWLLSKGYSWGSHQPDFDKFALMLHQKNRTLAAEFLSKLQFPLSKKTRKKLGNNKEKQPACCF